VHCALWEVRVAGRFIGYGGIVGGGAYVVNILGEVRVTGYGDCDRYVVFFPWFSCGSFLY
jgi:hypothetical protein